MNRTLAILFVLAILLAACAPGTGSPAPAETAPPAEAAPPAQTEPALTEAPIELAGPPMEVGSKYLYVDGSTLVAVPAGEFIMGSGGHDDPEHVVYLDDFWIYRAPVTNQQYAFCVGIGQCSLPDLTVNATYGDPLRANDPVVGVDYDQAVAYCATMHARLPTEAEEEKTGRGTDGNIYPWGDAAPTCDLLNAANCVRTTTDVTDYPQGQSYYEALDMAGNVYEWVADWYSPIYYSESPAENPLGPETGDKRSVRSSSFLSAFFETELSRRYSTYPLDRRSDLGFRCVVEDPLYFAPYCEYVVAYGDQFGSGLQGDDQTYKPECPVVKMKSGEKVCEGQQGYVYISHSITPSTWTEGVVLPDYAGAGCTDAGGGWWKCPHGAYLEIKADCKVTVIGEAPHCPDGYTLDGDTCKADGRPGECLPGATYDPVLECCTTALGPGDTIPLTPCESGYYYVGGACVPLPAAGDQKDDITAINTCTPNDGGGSASNPESSPLFAALQQGQARSPVAPVSGILTLSTLVVAGWIYLGKRS